MLKPNENSTQSTPFFSIVLPTYNRAHLLSGAINSVLNQSFDSWELLVVDDGSTDNTQSLVQSFPDKRIRYIYQDNAERSAARNNGINQAKGEYICFLDSDDSYDQHHLKKVYEAIESNKFQDAIYVVSSTAVKADSKEQTKINIKLGSNDMETVLLNSITPGQFITPAKIIESCGFNEKIRISEDTEILVRLVQKLPLYILAVHTLIYIKHDDNSVNTDRYNAFKDRKETLTMLFAEIPKAYLSRSLKRQLLSNCYFGIYKYHKAQGNIVMKKWTMLEALIRYPRHRFKEKLYLLLKG